MSYGQSYRIKTLDFVSLANIIEYSLSSISIFFTIFFNTMNLTERDPEIPLASITPKYKTAALPVGIVRGEGVGTKVVNNI